MRIEKIKKMMIEWKDYYGQDICAIDEIAEAVTKQDLLKIIDNHIGFLEMQNM